MRQSGRSSSPRTNEALNIVTRAQGLQVVQSCSSDRACACASKNCSFRYHNTSEDIMLQSSPLFVYISETKSSRGCLMAKHRQATSSSSRSTSHSYPGFSPIISWQAATPPGLLETTTALLLLTDSAYILDLSRIYYSSRSHHFSSLRSQRCLDLH